MLLTVNDHTIFVPPLCATCLTRTCKTAVRKHDHELTKTNVKCMWADHVSSNIHCYLTWPIHTLCWCSPSWLFTLYGVLFNVLSNRTFLWVAQMVYCTLVPCKVMLNVFTKVADHSHQRKEHIWTGTWTKLNYLRHGRLFWIDLSSLWL